MKKLKKVFVNQALIRFLHAKKIFGITIVGIALAASRSIATADPIIEDTFTSGSHYGTAIGADSAVPQAGLSPDTYNTPAYTPWQHIGAGYAQYGNSEVSNPYTPKYEVLFNNSSSVGIALSGTSIIDSSPFDFNVGSLEITTSVSYYLNQGGTTANASIAAGFSSILNPDTQGGPGDLANFTGLAVTNVGALQEYVDGTAVGSPEAFGGTFSAITPTTLSYVINTATGAISNVSFGSSTTAYSFQTSPSFLNADTANVEIGGGPGSDGVTDVGSTSAVFYNFELDSAQSTSSVPEPSTYALLTLGILTLAAVKIRRRSSS
jgi:hypothetical protein